MKLRMTGALCCALTMAACGGGDEPDTDAAAAAVPDSVAQSDSVFRSEPARESLPSHQIYYTLTSHEWYAQGQPLVHEGRPHQPGGMPIAASAGEMTKAGEFQGVEYYTRTGGDAGTVYVPVYEGYWQAFRSAAAN